MVTDGLNQENTVWFRHMVSWRWLGLRLYLCSLGYGFQHAVTWRRLAKSIASTVEVVYFNTQPPEGGWNTIISSAPFEPQFQHTAAWRRLGRLWYWPTNQEKFQHTAARRRLGKYAEIRDIFQDVSTHSCPKAASKINRQYGRGRLFQHTTAWKRLDLSCQSERGFNIQPPEGGWLGFDLRKSWAR